MQLKNEKETADITGLALSTLRNHRSAKVGIPYVKLGKSVRYDVADIENYVRERRVTTD